MIRIVAASAVLALTTGCGSDPVYFSDSVDLNFDFIAVLLGGDILTGPYVTGSSFTVYVDTTRQHLSMDGWTVSADGDAVLSIESVAYMPAMDSDSTDMIAVQVSVAGEGTADLVVTDERGRVVATAPLEVLTPDRAELHAAAPLFVPDANVASRTDEPRVLTGGEATFEVEWFAGEQRLSGNGGFDAIPGDGGLTAEVEQTFLFEDRDWVHLWPTTEGAHDLLLRKNGVDVQDVTVTGVNSADIAQVEVWGGDEGGAETGSWLALMAQGFDADGQLIYGVSYEWTANDVVQSGLGDLFRYEYDPAQTVTMRASYGDAAGEAVIHSSDGYVDSSNNVGCDATGGRSSAIAALAGLGLLIRRRR